MVVHGSVPVPLRRGLDAGPSAVNALAGTTAIESPNIPEVKGPAMAAHEEMTSESSCWRCLGIKGSAPSNLVSEFILATVRKPPLYSDA